MKNTRREVVERLVPFNAGELEFLRRLVSQADTGLGQNNGAAWAAKALIERVEAKINRAQRARYGR